MSEHCREKVDQEETSTASEWAQLDETDNMSPEEFIAYMANLDASSQKVLINLNSVINACLKYNELKETMERVVESNHIVSVQLEKFKEESVILKNRNDDLKSKIKADAKDLETLKDKVNEQRQIIDLAYETVEDKAKECAAKQKELVDAQVKIVELNRRLEQFRSSSFNLNHLLNSQRNSNDLTGLGYNEVPPPFNENYTFLAKEHEMTTTADSKTVNVSDKSKTDRSGESSTANQQVDERAKPVEKLPINTFQKKVRFVNIGNLEDESNKLQNFKNKQIKVKKIS